MIAELISEFILINVYYKFAVDNTNNMDNYPIICGFIYIDINMIICK